ncbi:MAG: Heimdall-CTERM domain-containing surface protein, partial [Candidatus Hodarchaeales archaeon]
SPSYTLDVPADLQGVNLTSLGVSATFPSAVSITLPEMAFYVENDAKLRMSMSDAFGLTVVTATNFFDVMTVSDPQYASHLDEPEDPTIKLEKDGNEFFWTSFKDKMNYKLKELDFAPFNIDPTVNRDVYITLFDPSGWAFTNIAKAYFIVEFSLAWAFTVFVASKIAPDIVHPAAGEHTEVINQIAYLTFTEFPEWYGGEIYHDPSYSAIAAAAAQAESTSTDLPPGTTTGLNIPGFELISTLLAIPPLYALYRKRRN